MYNFTGQFLGPGLQTLSRLKKQLSATYETFKTISSIFWTQNATFFICCRMN